jgi:N-acetylglutamate synthase
VDVVDGAIGVDELEEAAAWGWRAPVQERLGAWLLRAAEGFTGRANSALAVGDPGLDLADAVEAVRRWYAARGLPGMIAVPFPLAGPAGHDVDEYLERHGWRLRHSGATVMVASPKVIAAETGPLVELAAAPDEDWLALYHYQGSPLPPVAERLLTSAPWQAFGRVRADGRTIAIGRVAGYDGWAGVTAVETDPAFRRRGLASAVTQALAAVAADRGASGLYLQVAEGNDPALALYRRLGFTEHHRYHYRLAPA